MPYRFNPSGRPNGYTYTTGYVFVALGPIGVAAALMQRDWRWALLGAGSIIFAFVFYALLGWWRERYNELHPGQVDHNTERIDKWLDDAALTCVRALAELVPRRHGD